MTTPPSAPISEERLVADAVSKINYGIGPFRVLLAAEAHALARELIEARKLIADVTEHVTNIHRALKRGSATVDHGLMGNLRCIEDHVLDAKIEAGLARATGGNGNG